jgi:hypothetical protein
VEYVHGITQREKRKEKRRMLPVNDVDIEQNTMKRRKKEENEYFVSFIRLTKSVATQPSNKHDCELL